MMSLTSPSLTDTREVWEAWIVKLESMRTHDSTVKFALKRARQVIVDIEHEELNNVYT